MNEFCIKLKNLKNSPVKIILITYFIFIGLYHLIKRVIKAKL